MSDEMTRRDVLATGFAVGGAGMLPIAGIKAILRIPGEKALGEGRLASLIARGDQTVVKGADLMHIGMPVGGLCCGTVYLSGDGRLWLWDIFNENRFGVSQKPVMYEGSKLDAGSGNSYVDPQWPNSPFKIGFELDAHDATRPMDLTGWPDVSFRGRYPIGQVDYDDSEFPLSVRLEAFSPFVPLDALASMIPVTVMSFTLKSKSKSTISGSIRCRFENPVLIDTRKTKPASLSVKPMRLAGGECAMAMAGASPDLDRLAPDWGSFAVGGSSGSASAIGDEGTFEVPFRLEPGASHVATLYVAWYFPNCKLDVHGSETGRHYIGRFADASKVIEHMIAQRGDLESMTRAWVQTWYDSSLPHWFLDRTMAPTATLATTTAHQFQSGRFYGWEGIGCCAGTCTHVWSYAQACGRLFPELERSARKLGDFEYGYNPETGGIGMREELDHTVAVDGHAGTLLRMLREHQMSVDDSFLKEMWPKVKKAAQYLLDRDVNGDGIIDGSQDNTLDAAWWGKIPWISGLAAAAWLASAEMASDMEDSDFAAACRARAARARESIQTQLFNGEYFVQIPDPAHAGALGANGGCDIDQVYGPAWACQVGLPRVLDKEKTDSALNALWVHNFVPDVGAYRRDHPRGRWYAVSGEAGMIMVTNPSGKPNEFGDVAQWTYGYFNECMSGFEHQVAAHMIAEGMILEGLAVIKAIHDRYSPTKRNPYNEIECSDHYSRAMAAYGSFVSATGFKCHGPNKQLGFAPKWSEEKFRCAFVASEGWGTFEQRIMRRQMTVRIAPKWGRVRLKTLALELPEGKRAVAASAAVGGRSASVSTAQEGRRLELQFQPEIEVARGAEMKVEVTFA